MTLRMSIVLRVKSYMSEELLSRNKWLETELVDHINQSSFYFCVSSN